VEVNDERNQIQFIVTDNGIGIASEDLKKLLGLCIQVDSSLARQCQVAAENRIEPWLPGINNEEVIYH
jgi:HSP90 family molecular chaperone